MSLFYGCIQNPILRTLKLVHHKQARGNNQRYAITCVAKTATNSAWKQFKGKLFLKLILLVCQCKKWMSNMTPNLFCKYPKQQVISNWKVWTVEARKELKPGIRYGNTAYNTVAAIQKSTTPYYKHIDNFPRLWPIQNGDTKYLMANYFFKYCTLKMSICSRFTAYRSLCYFFDTSSKQEWIISERKSEIILCNKLFSVMLIFFTARPTYI